MTEFTCPQCRGWLENISDSLSCTSCGFSGNVRDSIVDLRVGRLDYYFNPVPRPVMNELVRPTSRENWQHVIRRFMANVGDNPDWIDNLVVDGRYSWKLFLDLPEDGVVLDLGCGLGNLSHNLAPHVGRIYAMDLTWERLEFSRLRFSLFNPVDDVQLIAGGDGPHLPFPDDSLDLVILSGVLEWIPDSETLWQTEGGKFAIAWNMALSFFGKRNPRKIQIQFLREIRRVLKPEGQLFIGIENRLNHEYFAGRPDHHSGLLYGALLPRLIANLYSIVASHRPYRTYTHSRRGYQGILREAGFATSSFIGLMDGYSKLKELLPFDFEKIIWKPVPSAVLKKKIRRHKYFVPAFGIVAGNNTAGGAPLLMRLLESISADAPSLNMKNLQFSRFSVTGKDKVVIEGETEAIKVIVKLPCNEAACSAEKANAAMLRALESGPLASIEVPRSLAMGIYQGFTYFVETRCDGYTLENSSDIADRDALIDKVYDLWRRVGAQEGGGRENYFDEAMIDHHIRNPIGVLRPLTAYPEELDSLGEQLCDRFKNQPVRSGLIHGDFSVNNIMVRNGQLTGLIDWEASSSCSPLVLDMINFLDSIERFSAKNCDLVDTMFALIEDKWPQKTEKTYFEKSLEDCAIPFEQRRDYVILYWLHHMAQQAPYYLQFNNLLIARRLDSVIKRLSELGVSH